MEEEEEEEEEGGGEAEEKPEPEKKSGTRAKYVAPPLSTIKKGITRQELQNLFNLSDLQAYCKQNGLPAAGK